MSVKNNRKTTVSFLDLVFTKLENTHCYDEKYGEYETLDEAKVVCHSDSNCIAVYDNSCDNKNAFYLCPKGLPLEDSPTSCIYQNPKASGRYS